MPHRAGLLSPSQISGSCRWCWQFSAVLTLRSAAAVQDAPHHVFRHIPATAIPAVSCSLRGMPHSASNSIAHDCLALPAGKAVSAAWSRCNNHTCIKLVELLNLQAAIRPSSEHLMLFARPRMDATPVCHRSPAPMAPAVSPCANNERDAGRRLRMPADTPRLVGQLCVSFKIGQGLERNQSTMELASSACQVLLQPSMGSSHAE